MESNSRISPDTQWVAFLATEGGATRVLVQQLGGGEPRPLTLERGTPQDLIWSPDGRQIMVVMLLDQTRVLQIYPAFFGGASVKSIPIANDIRAPRLLRWERDRICSMGWKKEEGRRTVTREGTCRQCA